ncbi:hypothetical protein [Nocardia sp. A7]|uniref:hypothetical protein n=1 Tax=Nocardia sp. A7 TaxID=2789274 RepID=UPI00397B3782
MSIDEPFFDPEDLLDELDSIIREQSMLEARTTALRARYAALEPFADRYNEPSGNPFIVKEHGCINVEYAAKYLDDASQHMQLTTKHGLKPARRLAEKVREYPAPEREQVGPGTGNAFADAIARSTERDGVER